LYVDRGLPVLHNTLIAGNFRGATGTTRDDVFGALNPGGDYNLIGDGTGMTGLSNGVNGNLVGSAAAPIDPRLGPLQDNGGPTLTHALLPGSPAIDAGNNAYATDWDQRGPGFPRIVNGIIDIGAFEFQDGGGPRPGPGALHGVIARTSFGGTPTAPDACGHTAAAPAGTARSTTGDEDPDVILPGGYPFAAEDAGSHASLGRATPVPPADQALTAADLDELLAGRIALAVKLG
jgi:hypothetical protein